MANYDVTLSPEERKKQANVAIQAQLGDQIKGVTDWNSDAGKQIHARAEAIRNTLGFSGGTDGSGYVPITTPPPSTSTPAVANPITKSANGNINYGQPIGPTFNGGNLATPVSGAGKPLDYGAPPPGGYSPTPVVPVADIAPPKVDPTYNPLQGFTPSMTPEQYAEMIKNIAQSTANAQYDPMKDDLKNRVAKVIADYTNQIGGLTTKYRPQYEVNADAEYKAGDAVKNILQQRGMIGSGVDVGNQSANILKYANLAQNIDTAKNTEQTDLNNKINEANAGLSSDLLGIDKQKAAQVTQALANSVKDYATMTQAEKSDYNNNYWKGIEANQNQQKLNTDKTVAFANLDISKDQLALDKQKFGADIELEYKKLDVSKEQFAQNLGLEYSKMSQQDKQFFTQLDQDNKQFGMKLTQDAKIAADQLGFDYKKLDVEDRQFTKQMGFNYDKMYNDNAIASQQIAAQISVANINASTAIAKMKQEEDQFNADMELKMSDKYNPQLRDLVYGENARVDTIINNALAIKADPNKKMSDSQLGAIIGTAINTSNLDQVTKSNKLKMVQEGLGLSKTFAGFGTTNPNATSDSAK